MIVSAILEHLEVNRESVLVIVDGTLVTSDASVGDGSTVEVRAVTSGGAL